jgi:acyl-CoA thioester hydrolase
MQTRWDDNDIYGHLNNTVHYRLFDTAVNRFLIANQMLDFHQGKTVYLVVETGCTYFSELAYPDNLIVGLAISHLGNSSVRYQTALFRQGETKAAAAGQFVHVCVDKQTRQPMSIDPASRAKFATLKIPE